MHINLNSKLVEETGAAVSYNNRAFRYGYGLYETMLVKDGQIQLAAYHWERLLAGAAALHFALPPLMTAIWLQAEVLRTVAKNKLEKLCRVRLQLYAGEGGMFDGYSNKPLFIIETFPLELHAVQLNEAGLTLGVATGISKANDALANYKTCNALIYAIAAQQAKANKWNDALVCNTAGNIIESAIANIFWVKEDVIFTPPLSEGCVAGVMRRYVMDKLPVIELPLSHATLQSADGCFLTNAIRGVKWVKKIGNKEYQSNIVSSLYDQLIKSH